MKLISNLLKKTKDGGKNSPVDAYFLIESKPLFSIALLKFNKGTREEYHSHAFDAMTWFIKGDLVEDRIINGKNVYKKYTRSLIPKVTLKENLHRVTALEDSWCFTIRGRWVDKWKEYSEKKKVTTVLTHGRKVVSESQEV